MATRPTDAELTNALRAALAIDPWDDPPLLNLDSDDSTQTGLRVEPQETRPMTPDRSEPKMLEYRAE